MKKLKKSEKLENHLLIFIDKKSLTNKTLFNFTIFEVKLRLKSHKYYFSRSKKSLSDSKYH
jgi:hypothetical protein